MPLVAVPWPASFLHRADSWHRGASRRRRGERDLRCRSLAALSPAVGPGVWSALQLEACRSDWEHTLSASELQALDRAVEASQVRTGEQLATYTAPPGLFGAELDALCARVRQTLFHGHGVFLLHGLPVHAWGAERSAVAYWLLGGAVGLPVPQNAAGHVLGHVRDIGGDPSNPQTRLYTTSAAQPFHTDSADVVGLLCLGVARYGGESNLASSAAVFNALLQTRPELAAALALPFVNDRKGEVPPGKAATFEMPVFCSAPDGRIVSMYDRTFIEAAVKRWPGVVPPLTPLQTAALEAADALAASPELRFDMVLAPGDVQWVHNHRAWHARGAFSDGEGAGRSKRHLLRLWLAARPEDAWPLPPVFAERYGHVDPLRQPPRGGVRCGVPLIAPLTV